ncbi:hypothetical protein OS493_025030 [Desmophyllum pertusum]|uniref:Uncharacterized protein n=1 Tax=Desmophyllum pertusum TaxID=174260 RepID=A0A9X0CLF4_9CNID|nr:hypothetical protein OS493_025030 [Desmophyllum pertusum]
MESGTQGLPPELQQLATKGNATGSKLAEDLETCTTTTKQPSTHTTDVDRLRIENKQLQKDMEMLQKDYQAEMENLEKENEELKSVP